VIAQLARKIELTSDNKLAGLGQQHLIQSEILQEERPIIVSLPNEYGDNDADYPVIYVLDGLENIKHTVGTIEILSESGLIPQMIIVGIHSLDRARDLTPSKAGQNEYGGTGDAGISQSGGAKQFLQFISDELFHIH
jgi:predicted alpha/beta superfamily hydrolase